MILEDIKQLRTGERDLRKFGLLVGGVFAVLGVIVWVRGRAYFPWLLVPGFALVSLGLILPRALKYIYLAWMSLAIVLGFVVSNVILAIFFVLVITPVGLIARLSGKDFLRLKLQREASSYWIPRRRSSQTAADFEKQF